MSINIDVFYWNEGSWSYIDELQEDFVKYVVYGSTREWKQKRKQLINKVSSKMT